MSKKDWVSVNDGLPIDGQIVMAWSGIDDVGVVVRFDRGVGGGGGIRVVGPEPSRGAFGGWPLDGVTHWTTLPEGPRSEVGS